MIGCQRIPLTEVRDIFIFPYLFMSVHYALSYQYFQFMYITCIYLSYHCLGWYTVRIWVFVCVCCAAPDKLTSPPPFTGFGALQVPPKRHIEFGIDLLPGSSPISMPTYRTAP